MLWLKNPKPAKAPPAPKTIELLAITTGLAQAPMLSPSMAYLQDHLPEQPLDRWGQPLPLSSVQQDRLNRLVAVLANPYERGMALLKSGTLDTIETNALREGTPEVYARINQEARMDMIQAGPPISLWAEAVLGVLFGRDAAIVYGESDQAPNPRSGFAGNPPLPTPSDMTAEHGLRR